MNSYRKTFVASVISLILGLGCCWLSSLIIWLGGATFVASMSNYLDGIQTLLLSLGVIMILVTVYLYRRSKRK